MPGSGEIEYTTKDNIVLTLVFILLALVVLLFILYKVLNKEANGEYTIRRMVYKEGGVRDRVRGVAIALGTRTGIQVWPRSEANEDEEEMEEEEMEEVHRQERGMEEGSRKKDSGSDEEERGEEREGDTSSLESSDSDEQTRLLDETEAKGGKEEKQEEVGDGEGKGEASGGAELLIDLKQFSGSAIWSEEEGGEGKGRDVTAL